MTEFVNNIQNNAENEIKSSANNSLSSDIDEGYFSETYWVGVKHGQSYLMRRRCLFSLGWPQFSDGFMIKILYEVDVLLY